MTVRATYRLQFREGMDFARAAALAPYLAKLGVSHLYASPIWRALPGSAHGYDIARYDEIEEQIERYLNSLGDPAHRAVAKFEAKEDQPELPSGCLREMEVTWRAGA